MAGLLTSGESTLAGGTSASGSSKLEEPDHSSSNWYFTREEIERNSPSRKDGIDLKRETYFRKSYCTFLQDLGMRLKVPQVTIATAIVFCHRFFLRQSHHKNDRLMIATICMFLAGKVEETPRGLVDVILMSYEIRFKKDQGAIQRIKQNQKEVVEEQKELVLVGERLVLTTLGFDLNIHHPYKPLVAAIKKFKVAQNALAQVAWNFVNDGLRTSLCLQFKPHHIAAGAIFLAAKFLKVKLPSDGEKVWWQEFDVTPRQLEEVSNQMLELYEQNKTGGLATTGAGSRSSDPSASAGVAGNRNKTCQSLSKLELLGLKSETAEEDWKASAGPAEIKQEVVMEVKTESITVKSETVLATSESVEEDRKPRASLEEKETNKDSLPQLKTEAVPVKTEPVEEERKPWVGLEDINKDKVKAALARRKSRGEGGESKPKLELADEDELLQRALEGDVEVSADTEKATHDRRDVKSKHGHRVEHDLPEMKKDRADEVEPASKRKRLEDEDLPSSDRRWLKAVENGDLRDARDTRDARDNRDTRDARDNRDTRDTRETREPHRGRDGAPHEKWGGDNRSNGNAMHRHGHNRSDGYYHHSNSHQHHHGDRERYHPRDRDWQERERDYKKSRHDQETLQPVPLRSSVF